MGAQIVTRHDNAKRIRNILGMRALGKTAIGGGAYACDSDNESY